MLHLPGRMHGHPSHDHIIFSHPLLYYFLWEVSVCLYVYGSDLRDPVAYSILGGGVTYPDHRLHWSLESVPSIRFLCFPS